MIKESKCKQCCWNSWLIGSGYYATQNPLKNSGDVVLQSRYTNYWTNIPIGKVIQGAGALVTL